MQPRLPGALLIGWLEGACVQWSQGSAPSDDELCEAADAECILGGNLWLIQMRRGAFQLLFVI